MGHGVLALFQREEEEEEERKTDGESRDGQQRCC